MFWLCTGELVVILALIVSAYLERRDLRDKINEMGKDISWYRDRHDENRQEILREKKLKCEAIEESVKWKTLVSRVQVDIEQTAGVEE